MDLDINHIKLQILEIKLFRHLEYLLKKVGFVLHPNY